MKVQGLWIRSCCLICKFLCAPFLISAQGSVFHYADSLYRMKNYSLAAVEYERVVFENPDPSFQAQAALKKANCLKQQRRFSDAAAYLDEINLPSLPAPLQYRILFESALDAYLADSPGQSASKLATLSHFYPDSALNKDILVMKILSLNEARQWRQADTVYRTFMAIYHPHLPAAANPYLKIPRLKDPEKAEKLSTYLPFTGAGLFYAGDVKEGILNIVLQAGLAAFGVYSIFMERYITGILVGIGGYASFYNGGKRRARSQAELYNEKHVLKFNTAVRNFLLELPQTTKHSTP